MKKTIEYGKSRIEYTLKFKDRKTLNIQVHPDSTVHVIAPLETSQEKIKEKVKRKASWIIKQQDFFLSFHPLTPKRKFVSGETHLYLGRQYRLKLKESNEEKVKLYAGNLHVFVNDKTNKERIEELLKQWYKSKAQIHFNELFQELLPTVEAFYTGETNLRYRWMKKRWGSCDKNGQIILNLELIKAPRRCIEYVIIHEFCHLAYLNHSRAFYDLLEKHCPDWRKTKDYLERFMC